MFKFTMISFAYHIPISYIISIKNKIHYYIYRMYKQGTRDASNIQSHLRNYLSEITGDDDTPLEYI